jgi:hypothetical protein
VGHHWRTKCALSGNQGGDGNGLAELASVTEGGDKPASDGEVDGAADAGATDESDVSESESAAPPPFDTSVKWPATVEGEGSSILRTVKRGIGG